MDGVNGQGWARQRWPERIRRHSGRGCHNNKKKKKLGVSNTPYDGGRWVTDGGWCVTDGGWCVTDGGWCVTDGGWCVTDGGWWVTDGGWWVTDGGWCVTDGGWCVTDGGWCVTDGGWWVTDGGWWVATKHQRVAALVKKKKGLSVPTATPAFRTVQFVLRDTPSHVYGYATRVPTSMHLHVPPRTLPPSLPLVFVFLFGPDQR